MKSLRVVPIQNKFVFSVIRNKERKMIKKSESSTEYQPNQMGKTTSIIVLQSTKIILDWERYFSDLCRRSNPRMKKEESVFNKTFYYPQPATSNCLFQSNKNK
jgi:hypothetical protein